jgi:methylmalonyl-CoA mutase
VPGGLDPVDRFEDLVALGLKAPISALTGAMVGEGGLTRAPSCPAFRLAEPFEELRERWAPPVWLTTVGATAEHAARTSWGLELLAAGGLKVAEQGTSYAASGARVAVISAADERFAELAPLVRQLVSAGALVWVLGRPGPHETNLREAGTRGFLHAGIDVLAALRALHAASRPA